MMLNVLRRHWRGLFPFGRSPATSSRYCSLGYPHTKRHHTGTLRTLEPDSSGHIETGPNEALYYVDTPTSRSFRSKWFGRFYFFSPVRWMTDSSRMSYIKKAIPPRLLDQVSGVIPRYQEGGQFIKLHHSPDTNPEHLDQETANYAAENSPGSWLNPFARVKVFRVHGRPWAEDLSHHFPSSKLKVEFLPASSETSAFEINQENLYSITRRYGQLTRIEPQASDSKVVPRYAMVEFRRLRSAIAAKNCLHGIKLSEALGGGKSGTILKFSYKQRGGARAIKNWAYNNPRIVIPAIAALIAGLTVIIFDPVRIFFIQKKISSSIKEDTWWKWVCDQVNRATVFFNVQSTPSNVEPIWDERDQDIRSLRRWITEGSDSFFVVYGPRGSGRSEFVLDEVHKHGALNLVIDCKTIQDARSDPAKVSTSASQVGYWPVFPWLDSIANVVDMGVQSTFGTKVSFSESVESQLNKIWFNAAAALKKTALSKRKSTDEDYHLSDLDYLESHPECRPVVIIDNFLYHNNQDHVLSKTLVEWADAVTRSGVARVVFTTSDASFPKALDRSFNQTFHHISLGDCSLEAAKRFVIGQLKTDRPKAVDVDNKQLDSSINILGGRLTDLQTFVRLLEIGEKPSDAVNRIVDQASNEVLRVFLLDSEEDESKKGISRPWSFEQAWTLIKALVNSRDGSLRYNDVLLNGFFKNQGRQAIDALEHAELISVSTVNGRPSAIKFGRPVYRAAFQQLLADDVMRSRLDITTLSRQIAAEGRIVQTCESELQVLGSAPGQPKWASGRTNYLWEKLTMAHKRILQFETEIGKLKRVLQNKY